MRELLAVRPDEPGRAGLDTPGPAWLPGPDFDRHVPRHGSHDGPDAGWRVRLRWDPGRRGAAALGVLLIVAVAATGWWLAASRPREVPISGPAAVPDTLTSSPVGSASESVSADSSAGSSSAVPPVFVSASASSVPIVVDVAGKVQHPGIYELPPGSRVYDAVRAAGGARAGVSTLSLNLAEPLLDGEQIVVGHAATATGAAAPGPDGAVSSSPAPMIVDLNAATLEQLETLPGIGPVLGQHILDWRDANGQFASVDQLQDVSGIGDVRFAQLSPLVTV